jgi:NADH dehydrogenase
MDHTKKPFVYSMLGQLAAIGKRTGVANILGLNFSGFLAWVLWRMIYLGKLPSLEKRVRVALQWTLDLFFSKDLIHYSAARACGDPHQNGAAIVAGTNQVSTQK